MSENTVLIPADALKLEGELAVPQGAGGVVAFAHGSGSSRFSPRNTYVAGVLQDAGIATLLFDLLTRAEDRDSARRFDIPLLTARLLAAARWLAAHPATHGLKLGLFGASTGAAAALQAAANLGEGVSAVVSRGGRPDLAGEDALRGVTAPTLLVVGGFDEWVIEANREAAALMSCRHELALVPGASHLFEEAGTLEQMARLACAWFQRYLG